MCLMINLNYPCAHLRFEIIIEKEPEDSKNIEKLTSIAKNVNRIPAAFLKRFCRLKSYSLSASCESA